MIFTIKDLKALLNEVVDAGHVTDDSDVIFSTGDPAKGGTVYLATASGFAQKTETTYFLKIKTQQEVVAAAMMEDTAKELQS